MARAPIDLRIASIARAASATLGLPTPPPPFDLNGGCFCQLCRLQPPHPCHPRLRLCCFPILPHGCPSHGAVCLFPPLCLQTAARASASPSRRPGHCWRAWPVVHIYCCVSGYVSPGTRATLRLGRWWLLAWRGVGPGPAASPVYRGGASSQFLLPLACCGRSSRRWREARRGGSSPRRGSRPPSALDRGGPWDLHIACEPPSSTRFSWANLFPWQAGMAGMVWVDCSRRCARQVGVRGAPGHPLVPGLGDSPGDASRTRPLPAAYHLRHCLAECREGGDRLHSRIARQLPRLGG